MIRIPLAVVATIALAGPAFADGLSPGRSGTGTLASTDAKIDGAYYACVPLQAQPGQTVIVTMTSTDFDTVLSVGYGSDCGTMFVVQHNDDASGMGKNSQVTVSIGWGETYWIRPTSWEDDKTGAYRLSAALQGAPSTSSAPANGFRLD